MLHAYNPICVLRPRRQWVWILGRNQFYSLIQNNIEWIQEVNEEVVLKTLTNEAPNNVSPYELWGQLLAKCQTITVYSVGTQLDTWRIKHNPASPGPGNALLGKGHEGKCGHAQPLQPSQRVAMKRSSTTFSPSSHLTSTSHHVSEPRFLIEVGICTNSGAP